MSPLRVRTVCPYCAVGCHLDLLVENGRVVGMAHAVDSPVNGGNLCAKGNAALDLLNHPERLRTPLRRTRSGWEPLGWDDALDLAAQRIQDVLRRHGPNALGFLSSAKCTNEENYLLQKLARLLGTNNVDHCARLCHASTLTGLAPVLGTGAATNPLTDLARARCLLFVGSNLAENHPVAFRWVRRAKDRGAVVLVADPRKTPTAWIADLHLPVRPGTDIALLNALLHVIIRDGLEDKAFIRSRTMGFQEAARAVRDATPQWAESVTGVPARDITRAARLFARSKPASLIYCMGITQHHNGTQAVRACADLVLATGNVGREGSGLIPVRGQDNVQGACDMGALSALLPGYGSVMDPRSRAALEALWGCAEGTIPDRPGLTVTEMEAAAGRSLRALVAMGENPMVTSPNGNRVAEGLGRLDFFLVMDLFLTESARSAHLVLPAAAWAEKSGSKTSADRRVQWSPRAVDPPGDARADAWIITRLARRLGLEPFFPYKTSEEVLREINRAVPPYAGITPERLQGAPAGLHWPCPQEGHPGTAILFQDGFPTPDGRARFFPVPFEPPPESPDADYPLCLTTGRVTAHYNSGAMSRRTPALMDLSPELFVEIHPDDAARLGVRAGRRVGVVTRRGKMEAVARVASTVPRGVVFAPFHFPGTNRLTLDVVDPEARIPAFKAAACRLEPVEEKNARA
ncbi:formate dehydrogenase major subunit [Desulfacinum hydrothermale DSM 13146]|uniref:Formate dehydrogenase major subunit n=1 Tax=Desulfacinum hydrothermale DSM 13146 TaxID=1121390 RepID=A0A1W1XCZ0_9BACT|nr:formate dehydrogenase subunit alpha [Desulfacinum hydrothermale]SMC21518.1 formate dehydrogenase major subunit [Desulfacinum hydrothermale DSM 13146]